MKALSAEEYIFQGVWMNWRKGHILGSTLTVNAYDASLLSPALAVLISIAGAQLWRLFQFILHQSRATTAKRNYLFYQQQVALRNTTTDLNTLWRLVRFGFAWRHQKEVRSFRQSLSLMLYTTLHLVLVILAGLFASSLLNAGDEVLTRSPWCGWYNNTYLNVVNSKDESDVNVRLSAESNSNIHSIYAGVQQHVDICQTAVDGCHTWPIENLRWTQSIDETQCPFESSLCHPDIKGAITFDTGYLSSASDLGFNAQEADRVSFRIYAQCAPLDDARFVSSWQDVEATASTPAYQIADAMYGPSANSARNASYSVVKEYLECEQRSVMPPYTLRVLHGTPGGTFETSTADFDPIPGLQLPHADIDLIMMTSTGVYQEPVLDPWFSAQIAYNDSNAFCEQWNKTLYSKDLPVTTIGCSTQWQLCSSDADSRFNVSTCTPLVGLSQVSNLLVSSDAQAGFSLNARQRATVNRIVQAGYGAGFNQVVDKLSSSTMAPLQARSLFSRGVGSPLPPDQWQTETRYWFSLMLAYLQDVSLQIGSGEFAASTDYVNVTLPSTTDAVQNAAYGLCQNQVIHSKTYQNFNFFAMMLTCVLCAIIIVLGLSLEDIIGLIRQHRGQFTEHNGRQDMWIINSDVEMLKTISELKTGTVWSRSPNGVPLAAVGSKARISDLSFNTWTTVKDKGIVHARTMTGLVQHKRRHHFFHHKKSHKRCTNSATPLELDSNMASKSGHEQTELTQNHTHATWYNIDQTQPSSMAMTFQNTSRAQVFNNDNDLYPHAHISDDERSSRDNQPHPIEHETLINDQFESDEEKSPYKDENSSRTLRTRFVEDARLHTELGESDRISQSTTRTKPGAGWGVLPQRLSGLWPPRRISGGFI